MHDLSEVFILPWCSAWNHKYLIWVIIIYFVILRHVGSFNDKKCSWSHSHVESSQVLLWFLVPINLNWFILIGFNSNTINLPFKLDCASNLDVYQFKLINSRNQFRLIKVIFKNSDIIIRTGAIFNESNIFRLKNTKEKSISIQQFTASFNIFTWIRFHHLKGGSGFLLLWFGEELI